MSDDDESYYPTLQHMREAGIKVTRESYIAHNWHGAIKPDAWTAEHEEELPPSLRDWDVFEEDEQGNLVLKGGDAYAAESDDDTYPRL